jgi:hypothetical protein
VLNLSTAASHRLPFCVQPAAEHHRSTLCTNRPRTILPQTLPVTHFLYGAPEAILCTSTRCCCAAYLDGMSGTQDGKHRTRSDRISWTLVTVRRHDARPVPRRLGRLTAPPPAQSCECAEKGIAPRDGRPGSRWRTSRTCIFTLAAHPRPRPASSSPHPRCRPLPSRFT